MATICSISISSIRRIHLTKWLRKVLKVTQNGAIRWKTYYWVYLTAALKVKYVAIEDIGNGIWKVFYRNVLLGYFDEKQLRNKEKSTRLETNLV
jgi:hypothetical protein